MSQNAQRRDRAGRGYAPAVGMALIVVVLSGCANLPGGPGGRDTWNEPAAIVDGYDCLAPNLGGWLVEPEVQGDGAPAESGEAAGPAHPDAPPVGRVPEGFEPVAAIRCNLMGSIEDADGIWSGTTADTLTGDLGPLLAALDQPDDAAWLGPCTADMELVPPLWLVDATGRAIHVHYPVTGCGKTKPAAREALAGLTTSETTTFKRRLIQPRAAIQAGCDAAWTAPSAEWSTRGVPQVMTLPVPHSPSTAGPHGPDSVIGATAEPASPSSAPIPHTVDGMRWCRYATQPTVPHAAVPDAGGPALEGLITLRTGRFVSGGLLDQADARRLRAAAEAAPVAAPDAAPDAGSCELASVAFVVLWPLRDGQSVGSALTAELDGCGLLYRNGVAPHPLPADVRELLAGLAAA
ncbi:hypothetical protein [Glaciibacter sp. 2TAF33]|uniref:hypothetical protein n=1 Tax=Glaciibacter sp. 2TAF33 TaxID=3233015 RepID=UPI003F92E22B